MSSIMKGIVDEGENVSVIYIDGKPSTKYARSHEAEEDAKRLRAKFPNKKIEIKQEVRETEAIRGADGKRCWKGKRYAGTVNGKDKCISVKETATEKDLADHEPRTVQGVYGAKSKQFSKRFKNQARQDRFFNHPDREGNYEIHYVQKVDEAANPAQQAAIAINMKKHHKKPKNVDEGVIVSHDAKDPEVAVLGGAGTMSLSRLKKKAHSEALQLADDIAKGKYSASSYNMKQLHNTLNTIVAAEEEMKKLYFGEAVDWQRGENNNEHDHTLEDAEEYLTHLYPVVKKYMIRRAEVGFRAGLRPNEKEFMKSMSHMKDVDAVIKYLGLNKLPTMSGSKQSTSSIGYTWTTFLSPNKKAAIIYYQDRGMGQDMIYIAAADKALHRKIYDLFVDAGVIVGRDKKVKEPELPQGMRVSGATSRDDAYNRAMNKFLGKNDDDGVNEDYTGEFAAEKTPAVNPYGGQKDRQFRGAISETPTDNPTGASGEGGWRKYSPKSAGTVEEARKSEFRQHVEQQQLEKLEKINKSSLPHWAKEYLTMINDPKGKVFKLGYRSFPKGQEARQEAMQYIMNKYKIPQEWMDKVNFLKGMHVVVDKEEDRHFNWDMPSMHEDTAYAGGMGQGHSGESYRKFKPKSAGTFKESAIMKGINKRK